MQLLAAKASLKFKTLKGLIAIYDLCFDTFDLESSVSHLVQETLVFTSASVQRVLQRKQRHM